jgi:hypothetical protein
MTFVFVKRLDTKKDSIFYSLIKYKNQILGFGRTHYRSIETRQVTLDTNFNITEDNNIIFRGEDPRCFIFNEKLYILDNMMDDMHLTDFETRIHTKINISGKNASFICHNSQLYLIHFMKPFDLYTIDVTTGNLTSVPVDEDSRKTHNLEYRGGTPGIKLNENEYYGYGHRTYYTHDGIVKHDIFKWIVHFDDEKPPKISFFDVDQPQNSKNICDPTSIFEIDGKKYLITAESDHIWFCDQDYVTNVYEIRD